MIIGLTGPVGSGKGEFAEYLKSKGFNYLSLSDAIREELSSKKMEITRDSLIKTGNDLRKKYGASVLAKRISKKADSLIASGKKDIIIDSIRNPEEIAELRKINGFFLVGVTAPQKMRFERVKARNRENETIKFSDFQKKDEFEIKGSAESSQRIGECLKGADAIIMNNSTIKKFHSKIDLLLAAKSKDNRPETDDYFLKIASVVAERSTCLRRHVGAVAVKDKRIIATGYNGAPSGVKDCLELGCLRNQLGIKSGTEQQICRAVHAEQNVIIQSAIHGQDISGATVYCTHSPCIICAKMLANAKIKRFVTYNEYSEDAFKALFLEAGIEIAKKKRPSEKITFLP